MVESKLPAMTRRTAHQLPVVIGSLLAVAVQPAAAAHDSLSCEVPADLEPLFGLLDTLTQLAFVGGVGLATLGILTAAMFLMLPGQDNTRRGKSVAKNVMIGTVLLLSANMVVSFLVSQLGGAICS